MTRGEDGLKQSISSTVKEVMASLDALGTTTIRSSRVLREVNAGIEAATIADKYDPVERAISKAQGPDFSWDDVIRMRLKEKGLTYAEDEIFPIIVGLAQEVARAYAEDYKKKLDKELAQKILQTNDDYNAMKATLAPFQHMLGQFLAATHLGPYEEIVSVAIKQADGEIRIESIGEGVGLR